MPFELGAPATLSPSRTVDYPRVVNGCFALFIFCGMVDILEGAPSPYDFASLLAIPVWFLGGFKVHRFILPFFWLMLLYNLGEFISLLPFLNEHDPTMFSLQSLYLTLTVLFFALFFAEQSERRAEICLQAFAASCVVSATCGIIGFFDLFGLSELFTRYGRASGTFRDPNVLGSYLILGAVYLIQTLIFRRTRHLIATVVALLIIGIGIFLSFSRGSWGAVTVATVVSVGLSFATSRDRSLRRRIVVVSLAVLSVAGLAITILLLFDSTREFFLQRAALVQDYDDGTTGRFGNQLRSLPMLLDRINGFGPLRFRLIFALDPHSSYVNAFASYGWLGGFSFILIVGLTFWVGFRVALQPSPVRRAAQVFWPVLMVLLFQAFQIDIDHWRHVYLLLGAVWGLETARVRWLQQAVAGIGRAPGRAAGAIA